MTRLMGLAAAVLKSNTALLSDCMSLAMFRIVRSYLHEANFCMKFNSGAFVFLSLLSSDALATIARSGLDRMIDGQDLGSIG